MSMMTLCFNVDDDFANSCNQIQSLGSKMRQNEDALCMYGPMRMMYDPVRMKLYPVQNEEDCTFIGSDSNT